MSIYSVMQSNHYFFKTWNVKLPQALSRCQHKVCSALFCQDQNLKLLHNVVCCLGTQSKCKFCAALVHPKINSYSWSWEIKSKLLSCNNMRAKYCRHFSFLFRYLVWKVVWVYGSTEYWIPMYLSSITDDSSWSIPRDGQYPSVPKLHRRENASLYFCGVWYSIL